MSRITRNQSQFQSVFLCSRFCVFYVNLIKIEILYRLHKECITKLTNSLNTLNSLKMTSIIATPTNIVETIDAGIKTTIDLVVKQEEVFVTKNLTKTELEIAIKSSVPEFDHTDMKVVDLKAKALELGIPTDKQVLKVAKPDPLHSKHMKNMVFGYWMTLKMKSDDLITEDTYNTIVAEYLKAFASVADQTAHYDQFILDTKAVTKELKKSIKDFHKPVKVKKEKVAKVPGAKKGRKAADKSCDNDDIVASIVAASLQVPVVVEAAVVKPVVTVAVEPIATVTVVVEPIVPATQPVAAVTIEPIVAAVVKPKRKYTRKKKVVEPAQTEPIATEPAAVAEPVIIAAVPLPIPVLVRNEPDVIEELEEDDMDEECEVEPFTAPDGKKYLIDKQRNLYDFETHEPVN